MKSNLKVRFLTESAVIAALYMVLTYVSASLNLAYGPVQFRLSEVLTILPVFTPAAIPGITIGCFLGNLGSPLGPIDWVFGSFASLAAAYITYILKDIKIKQIPVLSFLAPVVINAVIIGFEIACLSTSGDFSLSFISLSGFMYGALSVGLGEFVMCFVLGIPLYIAINKSRLSALLNK